MSSSFIGVDPAGVQDWQNRLNAKHQAVIQALNDYHQTAQSNNDVAHGSHFASLNTQCEDLVKNHLNAHHELHGQYTQKSHSLVQGVLDIAGH